MARIILNPFGSFGDLHPFLALAIELRNRGHQPVLATSEVYRPKILAEGIGFASVRPDVGVLLNDPRMLERIWDQRRGTANLLKEFVFPAVEQSFEDLSAISHEADLLVTHSAACAGPIVAEKLDKRWVSAVLQPAAFFSTFDPPVLSPLPWLNHARGIRWPFQLIRRLLLTISRRAIQPVLQLRRRLGLNTARNPLLEGQFSPYGTLALFSPRFGPPQSDWPQKTTATGFVFYDRLGAGFETDTSDNQLASFLDNGTPPVVFTLGSSAVMHPGNFFEQSAEAALKLGVRAVLLTGSPQPGSSLRHLPASILVASYAPYSKLLPHAALTVHQGGIGTTGQALAAGRPTLVVPWAHDQPDNAERLRRLGVSRTLNRSQYTAGNAASEIQALLDQPQYAERAAQLKNDLAGEKGVVTACDQLVSILPSTG